MSAALLKHPKVLLIGGSGFIGRHLAVALANRGYQVTLPCRHPQRLRQLNVLSNIRLVNNRLTDEASTASLFDGQNAVINLVGILNETRQNSFRKIHIDLVKSLISHALKYQVARFMHVSALGADQAQGKSLYLRTKGEAENLLHSYGKHQLNVTSFQPSVVFGEDDSFINRFATVIKFSAGIVPLACAHTRFAPVYVEDLVQLMVDSLNDPDSYSKKIQVCGPEILTLLQIVQLTARAMHQPCKVLALPDSLARLQANLLQRLPGKLFTMDNYRSLQTDSVCTADSGFQGQQKFSQFLQGLTSGFNQRKSYDLYRSFRD